MEREIMKPSVPFKCQRNIVLLFNQLPTHSFTVLNLCPSSFEKLGFCRMVFLYPVLLQINLMSSEISSQVMCVCAFSNCTTFPVFLFFLLLSQFFLMKHIVQTKYILTCNMLYLHYCFFFKQEFSIILRLQHRNFFIFLLDTFFFTVSQLFLRDVTLTKHDTCWTGYIDRIYFLYLMMITK